MRPPLLQVLCLTLVLCAWSPYAAATWSIIIVDTESHEVAIGSATCLTNFDLRRGLPVVRVGIGAAAAQSAIDDGANRLRIWNELAAGTDPDVILELLEQQDGLHQSRQYGIVDVLGRAATFTGANDGPYAAGLTGRVGTLVYAIQGNVITGQPVLDEAERAVRETSGSVPEKLMAAMEAARSMGGDGRCSCAQSDPPGCGSPPQVIWRKSAHIGFIIIARRGDVDGQCNPAVGCASGTYFLNFNYLAQFPGSIDPVQVLREQFNTWFFGRIGKPDQVRSRAAAVPPLVPADSGSNATLLIDLRDIQGNPPAAVESVSVTHDSGSAGIATIGSVIDRGGGQYEVVLTAGSGVGRDRYAVQTVSAGETRVLMPSPTLLFQARGDLNGDGAIDNFDIDPFVLALTAPGQFVEHFPDVRWEIVADVNMDGSVNVFDIDPFIALLAG